MQADIIIKNGRVIDPINNLDNVCDIAIKNDVIVAVGNNIKLASDLTKCFDAGGCIVTPGLIDAHIHGYEHCTPLGVNVDKRCLARGTTTAVDAGSAGAGTFAGFRKFIVEKSKTRMLAFLHIAAHGMAAAGCAGFGAGGECDSLNQVNPELCLSCIEDNRDLIVGVKVRLTADVCDNGRNEEEVYRRALSVSEKAGLPLMTHHSFSSIDKAAETTKLGCPGNLRAGDFHTHTYHGYPSTILNPDDQQINEGVLSARARGVLFDVGHGQGSFSWTVAEASAKQGFFPDIITTDLHSGNFDGPVYDLPTTMTKMLHIGMPLVEVIKAVTSVPAKALGREDMIGSLSVGMKADVTVLKVEDCSFELEDSQAQLRRITKIFVPKAVWKDGKQYQITTIDNFPNKDKLEMLGKPWEQLVVKDKVKCC